MLYCEINCSPLSCMSAQKAWIRPDSASYLQRWCALPKVLSHLSCRVTGQSWNESAPALSLSQARDVPGMETVSASRWLALDTISLKLLKERYIT